MLIDFTIRSGSGLARSIDSSPFLRSAPSTSMPSASTKTGLVLALPSPDDELAFLDRDVELIAREAGDRQRDPQALGLSVLTGDPFDVVGRVAVRRLGDPVERTLDLVEPKEEGAGQRWNSGHRFKALCKRL
jgi:hypothetical protein